MHELTPAVAAPTTALSGPDGQIRRTGAQGVFHADLRALSQAVLRVDGREPEPIMSTPAGPGAAWFVSLARWLGDPGPDPTVRIDRIRHALPGGLIEEISFGSTATVPVHTRVSLDLACDAAPIEVVKSGGDTTLLPSRAVPGGLSWNNGTIEVTVTGRDAQPRPAAVPTAAADPTPADPAPADVATADLTPAGPTPADPAAAGLNWTVDLPPGGRVTLRWQLQVVDRAAVVAPARRPIEWSRPQVTADDRRLVRLLDRALDDLASLRLIEPGHPDDTFLAAGVPWFLTLFGRDSIWAARMLLPLGTDLAAGTLRVLARWQGRRVDPSTGEAPGKIMHELRRNDSARSAAHTLPPAYYGTVDATLLWVSLLHDAWRWGMPADQVAALLPALEAALGWLAGPADPDRDGFVEYIDSSGRGLANQGWKDSFDAVRFHDGRLARPPIALCEVQGYAYQAATHGAALLDAFDRPGGERWRQYAAGMAERFRAQYWVDGPQGRFPALALDRDKRPVDALTSNAGHLIGTGLLSDAESAAVAGLLTSPTMSSGYGLRTMSTQDIGYGPLSYHCGSVWAHDTAIVLSGLARAGHGAQAATLADGLLAAAEAFDYRLPELYGGDGRQSTPRPVPYPAACRPQAWSAAAAVTILQAVVGLYPDVPSGQSTLRPLPGAPLGAVTACGLRVAGQPVNVSVDHTGAATLS